MFLPRRQAKSQVVRRQKRSPGIEETHICSGVGMYVGHTHVMDIVVGTEDVQMAVRV